MQITDYFPVFLAYRSTEPYTNCIRGCGSRFDLQEQLGLVKIRNRPPGSNIIQLFIAAPLQIKGEAGIMKQQFAFTIPESQPFRSKIKIAVFHLKIDKKFNQSLNQAQKAITWFKLLYLEDEFETWIVYLLTIMTRSPVTMMTNFCNRFQLAPRSQTCPTPFANRRTRSCFPARQRPASSLSRAWR